MPQAAAFGLGSERNGELGKFLSAGPTQPDAPFRKRPGALCGRRSEGRSSERVGAAVLRRDEAEGVEGGRPKAGLGRTALGAGSHRGTDDCGSSRGWMAVPRGTIRVVWMSGYKEFVPDLKIHSRQELNT